MRVTEAVMRAVAKNLGVADPTGGDRNWANMLRAIDDAIKQRDDCQGNPAMRDAGWVTVRPIYKRARELLGVVKGAWRDEAMHLDAKYDESDALRIFHAVRGFVEHLAAQLP
jgi:hypothetical protein